MNTESSQWCHLLEVSAHFTHKCLWRRLHVLMVCVQLWGPLASQLPQNSTQRAEFSAPPDPRSPFLMHITRSPKTPQPLVAGRKTCSIKLFITFCCHHPCPHPLVQCLFPRNAQNTRPNLPIHSPLS